MEPLIGADPELFVKRGNKNVSAHDLIPGTKEEPYEVDCGAVQVDGMALEFNINPARTEKEFVDNIDTVMAQLRHMVPDEYKFNISSYAGFSKDVFDSAPQKAKILGCEPDFNAYTGNENVAPNAAVDFRTASGHIHVGWIGEGQEVPSGHFMDCRTMAVYMDFYVGLPLSIMEKSDKRKKLYGKAGAFRPKPYGFEYRTSSNVWLNDKELVKTVYNRTKMAFDMCYQGYKLPMSKKWTQHYLDIDAMCANDYATYYSNDFYLSELVQKYERLL